MSLTEQRPCSHSTQTEGAGTVLPPAERYILAVELQLKHAGHRTLYLKVEAVGAPTAPVVWLAGGISSHRHAVANALDGSAGWWQDAIGAQRTLDPARFRLLSFDWLGADGDLDVAIDTADQADAIAAVLDALGITQLHAFVGASYGGMVGLQFAARHRQRLQRLVCLSAAHRPHPYASAFRALQRQIVALGQLQCADQLGLALARQLAMLSYRTPQEFAERFAAPATLEHGHCRTAAEDYLAACGAKYIARWHPTAFLRLSESIDLHALDPAQIKVPTWLFAVEQDWLTSVAELQALAAAIDAPVVLQRIESRYGHDSFLKEIDAVDALLQSALHDVSTQRFRTRAITTGACA